VEGRAPKRSKAQPNLQRRRSQPRRPCDDFFEFEFGNFMYLQPSEGFSLWNSATVMRRNGYRPSGVAAFLNAEFGIEAHEGGGTYMPKEALEYFERLVIRDGMNAPSLLRDDVWGTA
jgi:hypothetical protein